jgi:hypothetical protein
VPTQLGYMALFCFLVVDIDSGSVVSFPSYSYSEFASLDSPMIL